MTRPDTVPDTDRKTKSAVSGKPLLYSGNESFAALSDDTISRARCADTVDRVVLRCRKRGLELHLYRSAKPARWYARPTIAGKQHRLNLGTLISRPTVAEAHAALAEELLKVDRHGIEMIEDRATLGGLIHDFMDDFRRRKRSSSIENYEGALTKYAIPALGPKKLRQIRRADIVDCIDQTYAALLARGLKGTQATTLRTALQSVWRWGLAKGRVEHDIVARLPSPAPVDMRESVLTDDQLVVFWQATAPGSDAPVSNMLLAAFRVAAVTAQRIGAILITRADDLDLEAGVWTIHPRDGSKFKTKHVVPLPPLAMQVWRDALEISGARGDQPVFPADQERAGGRETLLQDSASTAMMRLRRQVMALDGVTLHDLRRTARTRISGRCHREDAERWIGHTIGSRVERTYDQDDHLGGKRRAAEAWEAYLKNVVGLTC